MTIQRTTLLALAFALAALGATAGDSGSAPEPGSTLEELLEYARERSPALRATHHAWLAALERVSQVRALPDPRLEVAVAAVPVETRVGPQRGRVALAQTLPGRGKRGTRAGLAEAEAETRRREYETARFRLDHDVTEAWCDLYLLARSERITRDNLDLLVNLEQAIRKSYETGRVSYADLIRAQVEIGRLANELGSLADLRRATAARLNSLLHREPDAPLPEPTVSAEPWTLLPHEQIRAVLLDEAPEIRELDARLERDERRLELASLERRPDWTFSLSWFPTGSAINPGTPDSGDDPILAAVSFNLPVRKGRLRATEREATEQRRATVEQRQAARDRLGDRLEWALYRFRNADREIRLYRDTLLPKAEQSFQASESGFRTGTGSVLELVDAQRELLRFALSYERARSERQQAVAQLRMLVGGEVLARGDTP